MNKSNYRILIVDDTVSIHEDYAKILTPHKFSEEQNSLKQMEAEILGISKQQTQAIHYDLDFAFQGEEALGIVQKAFSEKIYYSVAFMDVFMPPGWDGIETIKQIWKVDPFINMVICTAYADHSWNDLVEKLGINDKFLILKKPFENIEVRQLACCLTQKWSLAQEAGSRYDRLRKEIIQETENLAKLLEKTKYNQQ